MAKTAEASPGYHLIFFITSRRRRRRCVRHCYSSSASHPDLDLGVGRAQRRLCRLLRSCRLRCTTLLRLAPWQRHHAPPGAGVSSCPQSSVCGHGHAPSAHGGTQAYLPHMPAPCHGSAAAHQTRGKTANGKEIKMPCPIAVLAPCGPHTTLS